VVVVVVVVVVLSPPPPAPPEEEGKIPHTLPHPDNPEATRVKTAVKSKREPRVAALAPAETYRVEAACRAVARTSSSVGRRSGL